MFRFDSTTCQKAFKDHTHTQCLTPYTETRVTQLSEVGLMGLELKNRT